MKKLILLSLLASCSVQAGEVILRCTDSTNREDGKTFMITKNMNGSLNYVVSREVVVNPETCGSRWGCEHDVVIYYREKMQKFNTPVTGAWEFRGTRTSLRFEPALGMNQVLLTYGETQKVLVCR